MSQKFSQPAFTPESGLFLSRHPAQLQIRKICHSFAMTAIFTRKKHKVMDSGKEINILMILFIIFITGLALGMVLPDGIIQIIIGLVLGIIVLGLCLKSLIEHAQAHDQRVIETTDMAHYASAIYGNQEKQKQEKQDETETELEEVSAGKKAQMLARIKRQREKGLEFEINN